MEGAVFEVISKDGNIVCKLTTDKDGLATSIPLIVGKYTLKEVQAPKGYMLMREPVEIEVKSGMDSQRIRVVNKKSEFVIPDTGGIGTIIYYVIGGILMFVTLFLFVRKRNNER